MPITPKPFIYAMWSKINRRPALLGNELYNGVEVSRTVHFGVSAVTVVTVL